MNTESCHIPWDISLAELNGHLRAAGLEPVVMSAGAQSARDLDRSTRAALVDALHESVRRARADAPPVREWLPASESLVLSDDGSEAARQKADRFWQCLVQIVEGCLSLVMLGDLSEVPFFIELLRHEPGGHLVGLATDVLSHTMDPSRELDTPRLIQQAEEWWRHNQTRQISEP